MDFLPDEKIMCHHTGFTQKCRDIVVGSKCSKFCQIQGKDPQTGNDITRYGCIDGMLPHLLLEIAQQCRQTGAATEGLRNVVAKIAAKPVNDYILIDRKDRVGD